MGKKINSKHIIKDNIYIFFLELFILLIKIIRHIFINRINKNSVVLLPPAARGSLGDEAMIIATIDHLTSVKKIKQIGVILRDNNDLWDKLSNISKSLNIKDYFVYGAVKDLIRLIYFLMYYEYFYCFGADVLDGYYSEESSLRLISIVKISAKVGVKTKILGFSFNKQPTKSCVNAIRDLPKNVQLYCRDSQSYSRLKTYSLEHVVHLTCDLAFLLNPKKDSKNVLIAQDWIKNKKNDGYTVLGININSLFTKKILSIEHNELIKIYSDNLNALSAIKKVSYIFMPHDLRGTINDFVLAEKVNKQLVSSEKNNSFIIEQTCNPAEIKAICSQVDFVFSGRLHLAITCLSQGIPAIVLNYQDKAIGIYEQLGISDMVIEPSVLYHHLALANTLSDYINRRDELQKIINSRLPQAKYSAELNLI